MVSSPSSQCFYHWINTSASGLLVTDGIIRPVVSVSITGSIPLLVDYQSPMVSSAQQSVFLSLDQYLCQWTISHQWYHPPSNQCFYHWINTSASGLLVADGIIRPVVSVSITGSIPLLVDYQSPMVSSAQQSVFLSLDQYLCWWTISRRWYHPPSSQCLYHWINTYASGLLVADGIIRPVVSVSITGSIPLLVDYQSPMVSSAQQSVFLSLDQYLCQWTISRRWYHPPSSQCFYHWINTSASGLLVTDGIIRPVVSVSITGSIPLLVDYQSPMVSSAQQSVFLSLDQYLCQWTISRRWYHPPSSQCFYHWINTSASGLLVTDGIIRPVVSVSITGSIPLLVDYQSPMVSSAQQSVFLSLDQYLCQWTISRRWYHPPSSQCFITGSIPLLVDYQSPMVSSAQQSVFLSLDQYLCQWTISRRWYHPPSSQCFYHWINTSASGLLVADGIIRPVVSVSITGSIPLLVDYQSPMVSSAQQSVFLSLDQYLYQWTISRRWYHPPSSQCFYHWINTSASGLLVADGIIRPVVSVSITGSIPQLVDYQSPMVSSAQQSVFLSLDQYLCQWTISRRWYHPPSSQCFYHWINTSASGLLVADGIIRPVVSVSITGSIPLLVDYQSPMVSFVQQSVFLSLDQYLCQWTISRRWYHPPSSQCFYHWINTSASGLLVADGIIRPVVSVSITGSIPLLVDYQSPMVSSAQQSVFLSLGQYLCQWTISRRWYHPPSSQCFYHWINTSASGLLVADGIIRPVVSVSITGSIPLLVDYQSPMVSSAQQSLFLSLDQYLCQWTISRRWYHPPSSQCFYHWVNTSASGLLVADGIIRPVVSVSITGSIPLLVDYQSPMVSSAQQSVFLSLDQYLCQWTISRRWYHPPSSQCFYHWINTSASGLLVADGIIRPVVSVSITGSIPLLVDYQSPMVSSAQQSVFLSLDQYLCQWTISRRWYHPPSSQCFGTDMVYQIYLLL